MVVIYCPRSSEGASALAGWFANNGTPVIRAYSSDDLRAYKDAYDVRLVIAWGNPLHVDFGRNVHTLNAKAPTGNKFTELATLQRAGVPAPRVSLAREMGWLSRRRSHQDGNDLANPSPRGDYYVEKVETSHEFRINVFMGRAFRTGLKHPYRPDHHPFIRTKPHGWTWTYSQQALDELSFERQAFRAAAVKAVQALGYDFGAVDVGRRPDGSPVVFEVNSAPTLEGSDLARWGGLFKTMTRS